MTQGSDPGPSKVIPLPKTFVDGLQASYLDESLMQHVEQVIR